MSSLAILPRPQFDERPNALLIANADYDAWLAKGMELFAQYDQTKWQMMDWFAHGITHFPDEFWQAVFEAGYAKHTIDNSMRIWRVFPTPEDRVEGLSISHHEAVCAKKYEGQRYDLLNMAKQEGMTRDDLREYLGGPNKVESYIIEREVGTDGTLTLDQLPLETWGKLVRVRIELVRVA